MFREAVFWLHFSAGVATGLFIFNMGLQPE